MRKKEKKVVHRGRGGGACSCQTRFLTNRSVNCYWERGWRYFIKTETFDKLITHTCWVERLFIGSLRRSFDHNRRQVSNIFHVFVSKRTLSNIHHVPLSKGAFSGTVFVTNFVLLSWTSFLLSNIVFGVDTLVRTLSNIRTFFHTFSLRRSNCFLLSYISFIVVASIWNLASVWSSFEIFNCSNIFFCFSTEADIFFGTFG